MEIRYRKYDTIAILIKNDLSEFMRNEEVENKENLLRSCVRPYFNRFRRSKPMNWMHEGAGFNAAGLPTLIFIYIYV